MVGWCYVVSRTQPLVPGFWQFRDQAVRVGRRVGEGLSLLRDPANGGGLVGEGIVTQGTKSAPRARSPEKNVLHVVTRTMKR